jgi:hypothetical protein
MKNWKTSLLGLLATAGAFLKHSADARYQSLGDLCNQIALAAGLWFAADSSHPALQSPAASTAVTDPRQSKLPGVGLILLCVGLLCFGSGCVNTPAIIEALAKDPAAAHLQIRTIYGSVDVARVGGGTNSVQVTSDGISQNK